MRQEECNNVEASLGYFMSSRPVCIHMKTLSQKKKKITWWLKVLIALVEDHCFPTPTWTLTSIHNSSTRDPMPSSEDTKHKQGPLTYMHAQHLHIK